MSEFRPSRHRRRIVLADWRDAEELAVWHMRRSGFPDATATRPGADKGIDVADTKRRAVAQVKHLGSPVGAPDVQRLVGAGHMASEYQLFYSLSGYTRQAVEYARGVGVSLFTYSIYGDVTPANDSAQELLEAAVRWDEGPQLDEDDDVTHLGDRIALRGDLTEAENHDLLVFCTRTALDALLPHSTTTEDLDDIAELSGENPRLEPLARRYRDGVLGLTGDVIDCLHESKDQHWPSWCAMLEDWLERMRTLELLKGALERSDRWDDVGDVEERYLPRCPSGEDLLWHWWEHRKPAVEIDTEDLGLLFKLAPAPFTWTLPSAENITGLRRVLNAHRVTDLPSDRSRMSEAQHDQDDLNWDLNRLERWAGDGKLHVMRAIVDAQPFALTREQVIDVIEESQSSKKYRAGERRAHV
ncbi:restriction endonuclease [Cellulosimicrobium funkei]|uniref:restriction endonuclease n=1 Tax=Cellulosimicrobium funkei TaxID=264251 RepID=UPI0030F5D7CF